MSDASTPWRGPLLLALLILVGAWGLLYIWRTSFLVSDERVFTLWDDSMVSMRYARNLADGHGLVWNPGGERVQGITNLGVTLVMGLVHALRSPRRRRRWPSRCSRWPACSASCFS